MSSAYLPELVLYFFIVSSLKRSTSIITPFWRWIIFQIFHCNISFSAILSEWIEMRIPCIARVWFGRLEIRSLRFGVGKGVVCLDLVRRLLLREPGWVGSKPTLIDWRCFPGRKTWALVRGCTTGEGKERWCSSTGRTWRTSSWRSSTTMLLRRTSTSRSVVCAVINHTCDSQWLLCVAACLNHIIETMINTY